jgi:hypothetical protein
MLCRVRYLALAGIVASFAFAAPALAQEPVVGAPTVIDDQATETEPAPDSVLEDDGSDIPYADDGAPAPEPPPDASGRRGEIHVLDATSASAPAPAAAPATTAPARTLPFTGPHAGILALVGLALVAAGVALRRQPPQTF